MFLVLESGRQAGATTYFVNKIVEDSMKGLKVAVFCRNDFFMNKIFLSNRSNITHFPEIHTYTYTYTDLEKYDSIYVQNIENLSTKQLNIIAKLNKTILCDKIVNRNYTELEYNIARELKSKIYDDSITLKIEELQTILKVVDFESIKKLLNRNILRSDIQFLKINNSINFIKRIGMADFKNELLY